MGKNFSKEILCKFFQKLQTWIGFFSTIFEQNQNTRKFRIFIYLILQVCQGSVKLKNFFFDHPPPPPPPSVIMADSGLLSYQEGVVRRFRLGTAHFLSLLLFSCFPFLFFFLLSSFFFFPFSFSLFFFFHENTARARLE